MQEFRKILKIFGSIERTLRPLMSIVNRFKSVRLRELLCNDSTLIGITDNEGNQAKGMFPSNLLNEVRRFDSLILWKKVAGTADTEIPEPQAGLDVVFDRANN